MPETSQSFSIINSLIYCGISTAVSLIATLASEPKRQRILTYNGDIDLFIKEIKDIEREATEYWSENGNNLQVEYSIIGGRISCISRMQSLGRRKCKFFRQQDISTLLNSYFRLVTGGTFQQKSRISSPSLIDEAIKISNNLINNLETCKYQHSLINFLFVSTE